MKKAHRSKKPKIVWVGSTPVTPITPAERKKLNKLIRRRLKMRRRKYPEVRGKVVDYISHSFEDRDLYIGIWFKDKTVFSFRFSPKILADGIDIGDMKTGDYEIIREYYRRRLTEL